MKDFNVITPREKMFAAIYDGKYFTVEEVLAYIIEQTEENSQGYRLLAMTNYGAVIEIGGDCLNSLVRSINRGSLMYEQLNDSQQEFSGESIDELCEEIGCPIID